jgi:ATP-binding cassette subfamily B protein
LEHLDEPADFSTLTSRLRPERRSIGALGALLVVAMTLPLAGPLIIARFVDTAVDGGTASTLVSYAALYLAVALTADGLQLLVTWFSARLAWRVGNRLRADLCAHALSLDLAWHGEHSAGQLIERVDGDIDAVTRFSSTAVLHLLGNAVLFAGTLVVVSIIDWRVGLLIAAVAAVAVAVLVVMRRWAVPYRDHEREVLGDLYGDIEERLGGLEDLRANGAGGWAVHRLHVNSARWWRVCRGAAARGDGALCAADVVFAVGSALVLGLAVWLYRADTITIGTVLALFRYSQLISEPLWQVAEQLSEMQKAVAGTRRAARLLGTRPAIVDGEGTPLPSGALSVDFDAVTFGYGTGRPVVVDIDLRLAPGVRLGVVGRTGSGKTTLGRLLLRLWDTESGAVRLGGIDVRDAAADDLRRRVAVVTQEVEIFRATLRDNVTLFGTVEADDATIRAALTDVGLGAWLAALPDGLDTMLQGADELSAGEAQLLAFARVLLTDPGVVVLDEASSRLDPVTEARLGTAAEHLLAGRTAVVVAHRLATLDRVDEIVVMDHGRVIEQGRRLDLVADPSSHYARLLAAGRHTTADAALTSDESFAVGGGS